MTSMTAPRYVVTPTAKISHTKGGLNYWPATWRRPPDGWLVTDTEFRDGPIVADTMEGSLEIVVAFEARAELERVTEALRFALELPNATLAEMAAQLLEERVEAMHLLDTIEATYGDRPTPDRPSPTEHGSPHPAAGAPSDTRQILSHQATRVEVDTMAQGEENGRAKLTPKKVDQIRRLAALGGLADRRAIAAHFGLAASTVSDVTNGRLWPQVAPVPPGALRPVRIEDALDVIRTCGGAFGGPRGVVQLPPGVTPDDDDADDDDGEFDVARCRECGCTNDCSGCISRTGSPCSWVQADLCSACFPGAQGSQHRRA